MNDNNNLAPALARIESLLVGVQSGAVTARAAIESMYFETRSAMADARTEEEDVRCNLAVDAARSIYADPSDDDVEIDDDPVANLAGDPSEPIEDRGVWVQGWLYVHPHEIERTRKRQDRIEGRRLEELTKEVTP